MESILSTFGIDWRLLVINAVNFGVLMVALWYLLYAPITRMLEERRSKVAKGIEDAQAAATALAETESSRREVLSAAGKEADAVLAAARAAAAAKERELIAEAESSAGSLLTQAQAQAQELKHRAIEESKQEVAKLIVLGIEKTMTSGQAGK